MNKLRTHYDNLQVSRTASPEVIAAAYRSLCLKYHPDKNDGDAKYEQIMRILNRSYAVLSNPDLRIGHDIWIAGKEKRAGEFADSKSHNSASQASNPDPAEMISKSSGSIFRVAITLRRYGWLIIAVGLVVAVALAPSPKPQPSGLPTYDPNSSVAPPLPTVAVAPATYIRSTVAPNGSAWPTSADYVKGYPRLRMGGLSTVTVDNSENPDDVFVKLVSIGSKSTKPARQFFIPAYGKFIAQRVTSGEYDVRYMDLMNGSLSRTPSFELTQTDDEEGAHASTISMTLYQVADGNMKTYPLLPSEF